MYDVTGWSIDVAKPARRALSALPQDMQARVRAGLRRLALDPDAPDLDVLPLRAQPVGYRLRIGKWRVLFDRDDGARALVIQDIQPRGSAYD